ncbi:hypothetical protein B0H15DRAFT_793093 [Mycena belliarum]|uniref:Thioredoxin domain-containing protein n=1 Tax=Mycena belliarum TaxID=1033014 RepID=A0AAD6TMI3_9AGAR|nr:hypothetical protein B0H15DRAFT_793093 [Mycena belliae]
MTFRQELASFRIPEAKPTCVVPQAGSVAPSSEKLLVPNNNRCPTVVIFLRHCGCPFAEKTFKNLRATAAGAPGIRFVAVSHSDRDATDRWLEAVGGKGEVEIIVDPEREIFAQWGLGLSSFWHFLSPPGLWAAYRLGKDEGIWNGPTESGNRWQTSGCFAMDREGIVRWGGAMQRADEIPNLAEAVKMLRAE